MPRNSDFPNYRGVSVEHTNFDANEYHQRSFNKGEKSTDKTREAPGKMKGVWKLPNKGTTKTEELYEKPRDPALERAANQDWRNRGLSNNDIIDY